MSPPDQRFSDEDTALILQRAAQMQVEQGGNRTLAELQAAAAEAGIDAALVRRAAAEVTSLATRPALRPPARGGILGAPLRHSHQRTVARPIEGAPFHEIASEIERVLGLDGRARIDDRQLTWNSRERNVRVTVSPRGAQTLVRVEERTPELAGGLFLGMGLPVTFTALGLIIPMSLAVWHMPLLIPILFLGWAAFTFLLARTIYSTVARRRDAQLLETADVVADMLASAPTPSATPER
ncbi:MAG: hypothetical protein K0V04_42155 [Deltaproteobacteria bacterium]|nr:hypothetical protein [Deltaproteobacteria bacterium]